MPRITDIRSAIHTRVAAVSAISNAEKGRREGDPWPENKLPAANVYYDGGTRVPITKSQASRTFQHEEGYVVDLYTASSAGSTAEEAVDAIVDSVITDVEASPYDLNGTVMEIFASAIEYDPTDAYGNRLCSARITFTVVDIQ